VEQRIDAARAVEHLRRADRTLAAVIDAVGPFAMRIGDGDAFRALARAIIFQQLSGAAAARIADRLIERFAPGAERPPAVRRTDPRWQGAIGPFPTPDELLRVPDDELRAVGLSRQKIAALRDLARHFVAGTLSVEALHRWSDEEVIEHLTRVRGVGRWTAEMFLMFHLGRPDVLPLADLGIRRAVRRLYGLAALPRPAELEAIAEPWRPWRTVACWYLWRSEAVKTVGEG